MIGINTNILLYSLNPSSRFQPKAAAFITETFGDPSIRVGITDYVLVELYNHLRNTAVMRKPLSAKAAVDVVLSFLDASNVVRIESGPVMDEVWKKAASKNFPRRKIFDVRLGLTLVHHGVTEFATANVKDFSGLGFDRVWNPAK